MEAVFTMDTAGMKMAFKALKAANKKILPGAVGRVLLMLWLQLIIQKWPVDTGRSRAGWSAGAKFVGLKIPRSSNAGAVLEGAQKSGLEITGSAGNVIFEVINAVEYAPDLEDGTSKQAPAGAVAISLRELQGGRIPDDVLEIYERVWKRLPSDGSYGTIRAQDVNNWLQSQGVAVV